MKPRFLRFALNIAVLLASSSTLFAAEKPAPPKPLLADLKILPEINWESNVYCADKLPPPNLIVSFEFQGKAASLASQIGDVHVDSFVDGDGKSYKWRCRTYSSLREFSKRKVHVSLIIPNRPAIKSIREIRGSVMLETGSGRERVLLKNAFKNLDEPIADKRLESLGVRIIPTRPLDPPSDVQSPQQDCITIQTQWRKNPAKGQASEVAGCELFDAQGKRIPVAGVSESSGNSSRGFSFLLPKKLPPDAQVRVTIGLAGQHIRVPFSLHDTAVPAIPKKADIPIPPGGENVDATPVALNDPILAGLKTDLSVSWHYSPDLDVRVRLHGKPIEQASAFGEAEIDSVLDENGHEIYLNDDFTSRMSYRICSGALFDKDDGTIILRTREPPFPKTIRELKGSVAVQTGGRLEAIIVKNLLKDIGKPIESDALKAQGITVQVAEHKKNLDRRFGGPESLRLYFTWGPKASIQHFDVLDGQGNVVERAGSSGHEEACAGELLATYTKKLGPDTQLRIVVHKDSRKVRVPFAFKNVAIPEIEEEDEEDDFSVPPPVAAETLLSGDPLLKDLKLAAEACWAPSFGKSRQPALALDIGVTGDILKKASAYGEPTFDSAIDESGNPLTLSAFGRRMEARFCHDTPFGVEAVAQGAKETKKLREVRGSLALNVGGPTEIVVVKDFLKNYKKNKPLQDAALKAAGITAKVDYDRHPDKEVAAAETVSIELRWSGDPVVACEICEDDKLIVRQDGNAAVSSHGYQAVTWWHSFREPLPPKVDLRLVIQKNTRKVRVPFVLKDIKVTPMPKQEAKENE